MVKKKFITKEELKEHLVNRVSMIVDQMEEGEEINKIVMFSGSIDRSFGVTHRGAMGYSMPSNYSRIKAFLHRNDYSVNKDWEIFENEEEYKYTLTESTREFIEEMGLEE